MSRELTNGATGWRFAVRLFTMPFALAWTLIDVHLLEHAVTRIADWTDGT